MNSDPVELDSDAEVLPAVRFGRADQLLTPAYWVMRCSNASGAATDFVSRHGSLAEEVGFCLLGGFGVTFEIAQTFFHRLKAHGAFRLPIAVTETEILRLLDTPAEAEGRFTRYRFPRQRARRVHAAMSALATMDLDSSDAKLFRHQIQELEGIGLKTASWITRNWLDSDAVAILDIHVLRAGWAMNLFERSCRLPRDYFTLESKFIMFAAELHMRTSILDGVIWSDMRTFGSRLLRESADA